MHPTQHGTGSGPIRLTGRPGVPSRVCEACGEFLPHWCAPDITITRQKWTGNRIITITDRAVTGSGDAA